mgnify:CR=1 FL=1
MPVFVGIHKLRINPGNIRPRERVPELVHACKKAGIPIRVGVNGGSLDRALLGELLGQTELRELIDRDVLAELVRSVIRPLGPTLLEVPDRPADVALLQSFTSQMFTRKRASRVRRGRDYL